ncbi:two-component response regulator ORR21-like isoform X3 [Macadamia integrifolia]|uniref:two-component response regulator ORR21-like isoform X3 n=1 Tax=Macadamia integrifolia TaxID=60698 RepID=UPI001C4EAD75|nr:two-component response regulator ORR21-like isoform X3 [Macadamia integrifolia]
MDEKVSIDQLSSTEVSFFGLRVLLVDNNSTCLRIAETLLQTCKYEVLAVKKALDALDVLRCSRGGFDVILTEVHMPEMNGLELLDSINAEFKLPVVMMSSDTSKQLAWRCLEQGASYYFVKPLNINSVGATPKRILEMMNEPGLEKKHISSHLQKYRLSLKAGEKQQEFDDEPSLSSLDEEDELVNFSSAPSPPVSNTKQGKAECMTYQTSNDSFPVPNFGYPKSFPTSSSGMLKQPLPDLVAYFNQKNYINCSSSQMIPHNVRNEPSFYSDNAIGSVSSLETLKMVHQQSQMTLTTQSSSVSSSSIASANQLPAMSSNIIEEPPSVQSPGHLQNDDKVIEEADDILFNWMNCGSIFEDFDFPDHSVEK